MSEVPQNQTPLKRSVRAIPQQQEEKRERIKVWMGVCMVVVAFSIDCSEMILEWLGIGIFGLSSLLSLCTSLVFWIWFAILGVGFGSPKKLITSTTTAILEVVPGLDAVFGFFWTVGILLLVLMTMAEDKGGMLGKAAGMAQGKIIH